MAFDSESRDVRALGRVAMLACVLACVLACMLAGVVCFGCGEKVACSALCEREAQCFAEIAVAVGKATPEQTALIKEDARGPFQEKQRKRCLSNCRSPTKPSSMHTKWRGCLTEESCESFARCVYH